MGFKIESGLLDACALAILVEGDTYGYEITQSMKRAIVVSESTLYPVLRRLQKEGLCRTYEHAVSGQEQEILFHYGRRKEQARGVPYSMARLQTCYRYVPG